MIRVGILGAAKVATYALIEPAAGRDDVELIAVAARDAKRARTYADRHAIAHVERDYEALIARPDIDLIYNALPPNRHADLSINALQAGKHVLCEKPFAMNAAEARRMVDAAEAAGRHLIEAFHYRFHPAFRRLEELLVGGGIGTLRHINAVFSVPIPYRPGSLRHDPALGGGALMDLGCYPLHMVRTLARSEPEVEQAETVMSGEGVDLFTSARLSFGAVAEETATAGPVTAEIACDMREGVAFRSHIRLTGSDGTLSLSNPVHPHLGHELKRERRGEVAIETLTLDSTYAVQLAHVVDLLSGRADPVTGGEDAAATMTAIDAIRRRAAGQPGTGGSV